MLEKVNMCGYSHSQQTCSALQHGAVLNFCKCFPVYLTKQNFKKKYNVTKLRVCNIYYAMNVV